MREFSTAQASEECALKAARFALEQEAETVRQQLDDLNQWFPRVFTALVGLRGRLIVSGLGKSGHVGRKMAATLASTGTPSFFIHSTEALHGDAGMVVAEDAVILISNSGETAEVCRFAEVLAHRGITTVAMTKGANSTLARLTNHLIPLSVEREADPLNLAPSSSTTATIAIGDALASALMAAREFTAEEFGLHHVGGSLGNQLDADSLVPGDEA